MINALAAFILLPSSSHLLLPVIPSAISLYILRDFSQDPGVCPFKACNLVFQSSSLLMGPNAILSTSDSASSCCCIVPRIVLSLLSESVIFETPGIIYNIKNKKI